MATKKRLPDRLSREHSFGINYINVALTDLVCPDTEYHSAYKRQISVANCKLILEDDYYRPEVHIHIRYTTNDDWQVDIDIYIPWWEAKKLAEILNKLAEAGKYHDPAER